MTLHLYNTLSRSKEEFIPSDPNRVTMYVCGPTVYSYAHIGNARPAVVFDVLVRLLRHQWPKVVYARNITDIDDKINAAAKEQGVEIGTITERFETIYLEDMSAIGVQPPDLDPHATDHIPEMISMMEKLIADGHAYAAEGHVLFNVPSFPDYGGLSRRDQDELRARGSKSPPTSATPAISCCGNRLRRTFRAGTAPGGAAGPAGISNAHA